MSSSPISPIPSPSAPPAIVVAGAGLRYAGRALFDDLSVTFPAGRISCLLGPSGVGKSSLLRLIAGLEAGSGQVVITDGEGHPLNGRIAYMAQQDLLLPWASLLENVLLGARLRGEPPDRERARALLAELGLGGRLNDRPAILSGGMRQRTALARTLLENRPVILMDEPFSALDAITRFRLQGLAADMLRARTVLFVTHDPAEAVRLGEQIFVMAGRPAQLTALTPPPGTVPREPDAPAVLAAEGQLLRQLAAADQAVGEAV